MTQRRQRLPQLVERRILRLLESRTPIRATARESGVSTRTVQAVKRRHAPAPLAREVTE